MMNKLETIGKLPSTLLDPQCDTKTFYNYGKPRYIVATSAIIGSALLSDNNIILHNLHLFSCVCLGTMLYFHDQIEDLSSRYEEDGIDGIIDDFYLYFESKYLVAKEQYEYYKDFILANF